MKSSALKKILTINKRNPATIKQWLKSRAEYVELKKQIIEPEVAPDFTLGHLMPVTGEWKHFCPQGKHHLFNDFESRFTYVVDINSEKGFRNGKWFTASYGVHKVFITSVAVFKGRVLEWLRGPSDVVEKMILPEGFFWFKDCMGLGIKDNEGIDYHPYWTRYITVEDILNGYVNNKQRRLNQLQEAHTRNLLKRDLDNTFVNLEDSRRAGNCVEGSLVFAEQRLGLSREDVLAGQHLIQVRASRIFKDNGYNYDIRGNTACYQAYLRETTVSI